MAKIIKAFSLDPEIAHAFNNKYHGRASSLVEAYMRNMITNRLDREQIELDDVVEKRDKLEQDINKLISDRIALDNQIDQIKQQRELKEKDKAHSERVMDEKFLSCVQDAKFYHKFKHKYIMSGAMDNGLTEKEYFREYIKEYVEGGRDE